MEDGYANSKGRPQFTAIDDMEFEGCETEEERMDIINYNIQRDFEEKVSFRFVRVTEGVPSY